MWCCYQLELVRTAAAALLEDFVHLYTYLLVRLI